MSVAITITVSEHRWEFTLQPGGAGVTIGRGSEVDVSVNHASVSRRHCTIQLEASGLTVHDLSSANGTSINGNRITATTPLRAGDALRAGKVDVAVAVQKKGSGSRRSPKVAAPPPATDLVCESCGRLVTLSTVKDGQIVQWGDKILCPACKDASDTGTLEGLDSLVTLLAGEGFTVLNRISLANSYTPVFKARRTALNDLVAVKALPIIPGRTEKKLERFQTEARAMAQIHHAERDPRLRRARATGLHLPRHGVRRGRDAPAEARARRQAGAHPGPHHGPRPRASARDDLEAGDRPPRREAGEHHRRQGRARRSSGTSASRRTSCSWEAATRPASRRRSGRSATCPRASAERRGRRLPLRPLRARGDALHVLTGKLPYPTSATSSSSGRS